MMCRGYAVPLLMIMMAQTVTAFQVSEDPFALGVRNTEPQTADAQLSCFQLPDGFRIQLVASEPDIAKPMNLAFDTKGRLWVSSSLEYPFAAAGDQPARDTIRVLEDTTGDGRADRVTVFADGLNIPIGLIPWGRGVICFSIPNIWYLQDTDGDGRCDQRDILYGPFDTTRDTHGMCNAFRMGDDGWIYACHGFNNRSEVAGKDGHRVTLISGNTFRFRPDGSRIELYTQGQVNPFGMSIDRFGDIYTADCHTKPVTLLLPGGCYDSFGRPHDGVGYVPPVMDHLHGSTAIAALALGSHLNFPPEYADRTFDGNVMTSRINQNLLKRRGSSVRAIEQPDFVSTTDPWFRPVDLVSGPDGALYVADFYNRIIGHYEVDLKHPGRDRFRGRIWRISHVQGDAAWHTWSGNYQNSVSYGLDLTALSADTLFEMIDSATEAPIAEPQRRLAVEELLSRVHHQHGTATLSEAALSEMAGARLQAAGARTRQTSLRLLERLGTVTLKDLTTAASDPDETVRVHAFRSLREQPAHNQSADEQTVQLLKRGFGDLSGLVRRAAAAAASKQRSEKLIAPLLRMLHTTDLADVHLRHQIRIALRDHLLNEEWFRGIAVDSGLSMDRLALADLSLAIRTPAAAEFIASNAVYLGTADPGKLGDYLQFAAAFVDSEAASEVVAAIRERFANDTVLQRQLLLSMRNGFAQRSQPIPAAVRHWAVDLALSLLGMSTVDELDSLTIPQTLNWTWHPHPGTSDEGNCWAPTRARLCADGVAGVPLWSSFEAGEHRTGIYRSAQFTPGERLTFFVAGHDGFPDRPLKQTNFVRLRDASSGQLLLESSPPRNDVAQRVDWSTAEFHDRNVVVELVDGDTATAYAWLAVGRFSDERLNPSEHDVRQIAAAELIAGFGLKELQPVLSRLLTADGLTGSVRSAAAAAMLQLSPNSLLSAVARINDIAGAGDDLRSAALTAIALHDSDASPELLNAAFHAATSAEQLRLAEQLASDFTGTTELLRLTESGRAAAGLLLKPSVQQRLRAVASPEQQSRIQEMTRNLPAEDTLTEQLLQNRRLSMATGKGDPVAGEDLFRRNCRICHQLAGDGKQVGPNLDGIGNRGIDRILEDILAPNRNVDVAFRSTTVVTNDGRSFSGLLKELDENRISIIDTQAKEVIIPLDTIEERLTSSLSPMPSNFGETMTEDQLRSLITFLLLQRQTPEPIVPQ